MFSESEDESRECVSFPVRRDQWRRLFGACLLVIGVIFILVGGLGIVLGDSGTRQRSFLPGISAGTVAEHEDAFRIIDRANKSLREYDQTGYCEKDSGGTCYMKNCDESRGPTVCSASSFWRCECAEGFCMSKGRCRNTLLSLPTKDELNPRRCQKTTDQSCLVSGCNADLGPTRCRAWRCECADHHCWRGGQCVLSGAKSFETTLRNISTVKEIEETLRNIDWKQFR